MWTSTTLRRSKLWRYRTEMMAGLLLTVVLLAIGTLVGRGLLKTEQDAYERGARAAILHSVCRGSVPTVDYIHRAFQWGDLQTCEDLQHLEAPGTES